MTPLRRNFYSVFTVLCVYILRYGESNSGLLSSTLETFKETACDQEQMILRCPATTMISIQFSQYGRQVPSYQMCPSESDMDDWFQEDTNCLATTSLRVLFDRCQNRRSCQVVASTDTFKQDPCPRTSKYLSVSYKCNPSAYTNVTICEGEQLTLSCTKPSRIAIYSATFGRTPTDTSNCSEDFPSYADCRSSTAIEEVMTRCHGRKKCAVEAEEYVFGNPCPPDIKKYLKVVYTCVPKKILKNMQQHKIRHKNKKKKKRKKKKPTTAESDGLSEYIFSSTQSYDTVLDKVTKSPDIFPRDDADQTEDKADYSQDSSDKDVKGGSDSKDTKNTTTTVLCVNTTIPSAIPVAPAAGQGNAATGLIVDWLNTISFFEDNQEKALLYMIVGICFGIIVLLIVVLIKLAIRNKRDRKAKLDVTDPVHRNTIPPENHIEAPTLSRSDSIDRIEVVRFEPRSTLVRASLIDNGDRSLNHYYG